MFRRIVPVLTMSTLLLVQALPAQEVIEGDRPMIIRPGEMDGPIVIRLSEMDTGHIYDSVVSEIVQRYGLAVANSADDEEDLHAALADTLAKQYDHFAFHDEPDEASDGPADELIRELMQRRRDSREDFIELRLTILEHRAEGDSVPDMIAQSFRDLCSELDLHVRPDQFLHEGAVDPERRVLAIEFPNMCCGGCVQKVRDALTVMEGVDDVEVEMASKICQFTLRRDMEIEGKLNELAESLKVFADWSVAWAAD
ncbi:MAG: heavy-metal-associated domain-containing protein [Pirellulaceae bacterium]